MRDIIAQPLTDEAFAPYGDVLDASGDWRSINEGWCSRHHDRAKLDFGPAGRAGISVFKARPRSLPYEFSLIEQHPEGSQAFIPMTDDPFLVIVSDGPDATPKAFITDGTQAINYARGTWHGVLTPLHEPGLFAVVDRIGETPNLVEHRFEQPWRVLHP